MADGANGPFGEARRFQQLVDSAPDAIVGVGTDGRIAIFSRRATELFGYGRSEAVGRRIESLVPRSVRGAHPMHRARFFADPQTRQMGPDLRLLAQRKDGSEFPCEISLTAIETSGGRVAVAAVRDVSERLAIEAALRKSEDARRRTLEKMLRLQNEDRSKLAADLHDDTIQVMTAALLELGIVERRVRRLGDEPSEQAIEKARTSLSHAIERTRRMTFDLRPQLLEAEGIAMAIRGLADAAATESGFTVTVSVDASRYPQTLESLVYRTFQECLANIRKHADATAVTISLDDRDGELRGEITDDGVGFDVATELEHARITFHVGIDIVSERVRLTGGSFEIDSTPGEGTTIRFTVPIVNLPADSDAPIRV